MVNNSNKIVQTKSIQQAMYLDSPLRDHDLDVFGAVFRVRSK